MVFEVEKVGSVCYSIEVGESLDKYFFFWKLLLRDDSKLRINVQALPFMTRTGSCEVVNNTIVIGLHSREVFLSISVEKSFFDIFMKKWVSSLSCDFLKALDRPGWFTVSYDFISLMIPIKNDSYTTCGYVK